MHINSEEQPLTLHDLCHFRIFIFQFSNRIKNKKLRGNIMQINCCNKLKIVKREREKNKQLNKFVHHLNDMCN